MTNSGSTAVTAHVREQHPSQLGRAAACGPLAPAFGFASPRPLAAFPPPPPAS